MVTPFRAAAVEEAPLIQWAVNSALMPLAVMACFSHLAMVEEVTGLCGEMIARKVADSPF
jgi:hypothetical protein